MAIISKAPPWETFYHEIEALFDGDLDIDVMRSYSEKEKRIVIYVQNNEKYEILTRYMPTKRNFGGVEVLIELVPADKKEVKNNTQEDMKKLFAGNGNVSRVETLEIPGGSVTYVAFKKDVVQFYDDNLADINRNKSMLMEAVARDVLNEPIDGVYFCTDSNKENTFTSISADLFNRMFEIKTDKF